MEVRADGERKLTVVAFVGLSKLFRTRGESEYPGSLCIRNVQITFSWHKRVQLPAPSVALVFRVLRLRLDLIVIDWE